jgi:hypothetical protein
MSAALYTASWRALWEGWKVGTLDVTPCSISVVTYPKFWPESQAYPRLELLAPRGIFGVVKDPAEYAARYLDRLERAGVDAITEALRQLREENQDLALCCACYCRDAASCHRTTFARFMTDRGIEVAEWSPPAATQLQMEES